MAPQLLGEPRSSFAHFALPIMVSYHAELQTVLILWNLVFSFVFFNPLLLSLQCLYIVLHSAGRTGCCSAREGALYHFSIVCICGLRPMHFQFFNAYFSSIYISVHKWHTSMSTTYFFVYCKTLTYYYPRFLFVSWLAN